MKKHIGIIGLGDMGFSMAQNILKAGYQLTGFDLREERLEMLEALGGKRASSPAEVGEVADAVFIMVMTGKQAESIVSGEEGLLKTMNPGKTILLTATIEPHEARSIGKTVAKKGVHLIDAPVSGGQNGAESGTLALMAAADKKVWDENLDLMKAVGENIFHVGEEIGIGQTVKASLQALIGCTFTAIFESLVLGSKAGVSGKVLYEVFSASGVSSPLFKNCAKLIMDRKFKDTGSQIGTMYKDLGITMDLARQNGVPMFTTAAAQQLFQSGISKFPEEDNWTITKVLEEIAGTEVKW
ncbi:MAG: NAD(P)-dependent oxidoreductase [Verrucomicrobia bacterium]|jgi:3-hydroxyisobutyrate dehydrogenase-like beta-hydroxyacid dehydrogenase|nr:NAD(P)-dependent oxidoreductase [Verrucomicrobiota bacterium]MBT5062582.1 NAD(P)-dependent oxidoreductase [Verrucomicrobiota bacterium]MBT6239040.1 NAD(P)-dependent oxidoreductase [Verrucomicrobiota bacterium]MBT6805438.1 NAD(P)-dependent oxidoreductase [Verrucomicrobiota bacterium]MBT7537130.1 NAD(P)-dependent oxidoreductase [Verrucomicrobiota bacterium]